MRFIFHAILVHCSVLNKIYLANFIKAKGTFSTYSYFAEITKIHVSLNWISPFNIWKSTMCLCFWVGFHVIILSKLLIITVQLHFSVFTYNVNSSYLALRHVSDQLMQSGLYRRWFQNSSQDIIWPIEISYPPSYPVAVPLELPIFQMNIRY